MRALLIAAATAAAALAPNPAIAQSGGEDPVTACRAAHGANLEARVACLEAAVAALRAAAPQREASSGRPSWTIPGFRRERPDEPESIRVRIVESTYGGGGGRGRYVTEDGQIWRETEPAPLRHQLREGRVYQAEISRFMLGGFRMRVDGVTWLYKVEPAER